MDILKKFAKIFGYILFFLFLALVGFLLWNNFPPLPPKAEYRVEKYDELLTNLPPPSELTVVTYNIQFGMGLNGRRTDKLKAWDFYERLQALADILKEINADIVLLQEVDFRSSRTHKIDQAYFLAQKAGYAYIARAPHFRTRLLPDLAGHIGPLNHGLAILSRFPILSNESRVFSHPTEAPFYVRWLYSPHGAQKAIVLIGTKTINLINVHLEPWAQKTREQSVQKIVSWIKKIQGPIIVGGDFNAIPPEAPFKTYYNLEDTPWFINRDKWDIENDRTISDIRILGLSEAIPPEEYLADEPSAFTYPSNDPMQRLDYLFAGKGITITRAFVYRKAGEASDHLPVVAKLSMKDEG